MSALFTPDQFRIATGTPVLPYPLPSSGRLVRVKREDRCCPYPGPTFSKIRGVYAHIKAQQEAQVIGVLDTYHSKAGWAVAAVCRALGKHCVDYWPLYKADSGKALRYQQQQALDWGAELRALPAGRSAVLYHAARKATAGYMMPNALKLPETIEETAAEVGRTVLPYAHTAWTLVISVSSGTIMAGVLRGLVDAGNLPSKIIAHQGYSRPVGAFLKYVQTMSGIEPNTWDWDIAPRIEVVDESYNYKDPAREGADAPFPCNPWYDLKAWRWLDNVALRDPRRLSPGPILFWNIGD